MVFGIAIGEREIDGERMQSSTLAVPIARAIELLGEDAKSLLGVSYDPDCNKLLNSEFTAVLTNPVEVQVHTVATGGGFFGLPPTAMQISRIHANVRPPEGYRVVSAQGVTFDHPGINGNIVINEGGSNVDVTASKLSAFIPRDVTVSVPVVLQKISPKKQTPSIQLRIFPYSKTLDKHEMNVTSTDFHDTIKAPDGFVFQSVVKIDYQSLNNSPSNGATVSINSDGSALDINYSLQSGPIYDQWRGWIDAFITAKIVPKPLIQ
jgi:serine protease Do